METAPRNKTPFPLHEAVESGNLEVLKTLLDNGGDINVKNNSGDTLLHVAVNRNNHQSQELVTLLLERGANPRLLNRQGNTPLILAVKYNPKCVPLMLRNDSGKDTINIPGSKQGIPTLHLALRKICILSHAIAVEVNIDNQPNCQSVERKALDVYHNVTNQLLMHGEEVNSKDKYGNTPLHEAADIKCVLLLLDKGALVNSRNSVGKTPLHEAVRVSFDVANELLLHGAEVNSVDNNGNTPLYMARYVECFRLLLDKGALVNSRNNVGETALHKLSRYDREKACELLLHGADVNSKDNYGNTPLYTAFNIDCFRLLLEKGALVNSRNSVGETPLHKLLVNDRDKAYELLFHGADVNSKDNYGNTPLHKACENNAKLNRHKLCRRSVTDYGEHSGYLTNVNVAKILLDWGASLTTKNNKGRTPSDIYPNLLDRAIPHDVRKACLRLSVIPCNEFKLKSYWISCLEEVARLKLVRFGKNSLCNIFYQYSDPIFLSNESLQKAVEIKSCKKNSPFIAICCNQHTS